MASTRVEHALRYSILEGETLRHIVAENKTFGAVTLLQKILVHVNVYTCAAMRVLLQTFAYTSEKRAIEASPCFSLKTPDFSQIRKKIEQFCNWELKIYKRPKSAKFLFIGEGSCFIRRLKIDWSPHPFCR